MESHLSDAQYLDLLQKIKARINQPEFVVYCYDSTVVGNRYTESNCGLCNEEFVTADTAMFPGYFPGRRDMKYRQKHHKCPFDLRGAEPAEGFSMGCFYSCYLFKNRQHDLVHMNALVDGALKKVPCFAKEAPCSPLP